MTPVSYFRCPRFLSFIYSNKFPSPKMGVFAIRILLFASILFGMSLTDGNETPIDSNFTPIPFDAVEFNIFGDTKHTFETSVNATLKTVRNFFKTRVAEAAFGMGHVFVTTLPIIKPFNRFVTAFRSILEDESEWKELFSKTVVNETKREIVKERIVWMKSTLKIMQEKMNVLNETNPDFDNRKAVASIIHSSFDKMINYFAHRDALFKKYPLIGVVPLIELASLVTIFHPLSEILIPFQTKSPQIACKLNDILLDYRTRAVDARLDRLHTKNESDMIQFRSIITTVQTIPYNLNGYSEQKLLKCARGCDNSTNFICIRDEFGPAEFSAVHEDCLKEYAGLVRHRVEEMFPIELLHELCGDRKPNTPTGNLNFLFLPKLRFFVIDFLVD